MAGAPVAGGDFLDRRALGLAAGEGVLAAGVVRQRTTRGAREAVRLGNQSRRFRLCNV